MPQSLIVEHEAWLVQYRVEGMPDAEERVDEVVGHPSGREYQESRVGLVNGLCKPRLQRPNQLLVGRWCLFMKGPQAIHQRQQISDEGNRRGTSIAD